LADALAVLEGGLPMVIAIDVGGTSIKGALVAAGAEMVAVRRAATPHDGEHQLVTSVVGMATDLAAEAARRGTPASAIGVAAAGIIDEAAGVAVRGANLRWRDTALTRRMEDATGLPATLVQDARAAARGEAIFGAGRNADTFLSVILGTGVGSAVVIDGRPVRGSHGLAGEIGHLQVDPGGLPCGCGGRGCVETVASAAAISRRYAAASGEHLATELVLARATAGDRLAATLWSEAVAALAAALAAAVAVVDCDLVVLAGGLARAGDLLFEPLALELAGRLSLVAPPRLAAAALGRAAGVLGAAASALDEVGRGDLIRSWREMPIASLLLTDPFGSRS
jgi:glucokinase